MDIRTTIINAVSAAVRAILNDVQLQAVQDALTLQLNTYELQERTTEIATVDNTPDTTTEDDTEPAPIGSDTTTDTGTTDQGATQTQPNTDNTGTSTDVADDVPALGSME